MENKEMPEGLVEEVARAIWSSWDCKEDGDDRIKVYAKAALSVIAPHYEKQIAELKAQIPQWQDISTVPKDGTEILILYDFGGVEKVQWDSEMECWQQCCDNDIKNTTRGAIGYILISNLPKPPAEEK